MRRNISFIKKIRLFGDYKRTLIRTKNELNVKFGARVDSAYRIYNVINLPQEIIAEPYNVRKTDIDKIAEGFIKEYSISLSNYLNANGLTELFNFYEVSKVDKYSYLVVVGFSLFKSHEYYNTIRFKILPSVVISILLLLLILMFV